MTTQDEALAILDVAGNVRAEVARRQIGQAAIAAALGENQQWVSRRMASPTVIRTPNLPN